MTNMKAQSLELEGRVEALEADKLVKSAGAMSDTHRESVGEF